MSLDNFKKQTITWDMINQTFEQPIQIMEGDVNARTLLLKITDNGSVLDLTGYSVKLTYQYMYKSQSGFIMLTPNDISKGEFTLIIPTEMTVSGLIKSNLILLNESLEQVIVSKNLTFISDNSTVTDLAQEVNNKIDDFTKLLLENMPQVMRSELNDLHAQTEANTSNIELKANLADITSLQNAMTNLQNEVEVFGITPENLVTIKSLLDAIASNASQSQVSELINSVNVLTSNIALMSNGDYSPKANQTDLESLQSSVNNQSATISTKANQTDLIATDLTVKNLSDRKADISLVNDLLANALHGDTIVQNTAEPAPEYKDLNNLKPNTVVNYAIIDGKVLNVPTSFASTGSFTVATLSPINDIKQQSIQILIDKNNMFFYRICWNGWWLEWSMPDKWSAQNKIFSAGVLVAPYDNLNTLPVPSTVTYGRGDVLNAPVGVVDYVVTTMSGSGNLSGAMQLLVDKNTGNTYTRVGWGPTSNIYFTSWNQLDKEPETPTPQEERYDSPSLSMFGNFGVIGDSFASGSLKVGEEWGGQTDNTTWGAMIARKWGTNMLHLASSGLSTRSWLAHYNGLTKLNASDSQDIYYCVLGINDFWSLGLDYIGTIDDVESGSDTFFGNYGKIIKAIQAKAPKAKIILFSIADPSTVATSFNVAIKALANHFGIPYVDQKTDGLFTSSYYLNNMVGGHPTGPMYASMALAFERLIKKAVVDNFTYFKDYGL